MYQSSFLMILAS